MESRVLGIPLIVIVFIVLLAALIDLPMLWLHNGEIRAITKLSVTPTVTSVPTLTVTPTASPSATPTVPVKTYSPIKVVPTTTK